MYTKVDCSQVGVTSCRLLVCDWDMLHTIRYHKGLGAGAPAHHGFRHGAGRVRKPENSMVAVHSQSGCPHIGTQGCFCHYSLHWSRAVPEIILGGWATFFFRPLHPQNTHGIRAPRPSGHPPHPTMDQIRLDPQDKWTPHPSDTSTKHPPLTGQKSACGPPPTLRIISGTALTLGMPTYS